MKTSTPSRLTLFGLALLGTTLTLTGCPQIPDPAHTESAPEPADTAAMPKLEGFHWQLSEASDASGQSLDTLFVRTDPPVTLDFADGRVAISGTCNRMNGGYALEGNTLTAGQLASTMMACVDPKLMALDQEIGTRLQGPLQVSVASGDTPRLTLVNAAGDRLLFNGVPTPETRYGGPGERMFLEVAAQTRPCPHPLIPDLQCLQVREIHYDGKGLKTGTADEFQHFYGSIEGYTHQPGIRNVLRVNRYAIKNPPADGSSLAYVLDMVVESEVVKK
ncbi:hypothetical protein CSC70_02720 [Pseudoxanthomonas kalamensis DSM 18571]|uniref:META and DUF4377 domain-containing protein n=1 Tax=Pseudoxanthomonas kalamensis TaxID=289483 RepID=UPI00139128A8|nr:META and DUF4377 domain-containing protein [Pseudoxanthomonas kalamensis]KAF1712451.1 hypothetical protein CSC70_02720 [Pseudoxanthomonas kalamensis DSM 18571]